MAFQSKNTADSQLPGARSGLELTYPARAVEPSAWLGHTPFAFWLIEVLRPRLVVEVGVDTGNAYCAFLEAVHALGLDTRCFGMDEWKGDEHAEHGGDDAYQELRDYHDPRYGSFSTLLRSSADDALHSFAEGSIDLLHIDGCHSYEVVSDTFKAWLPKASSRAIVLFHNTNVRDRGFGVWRFWNELASSHPQFEFLHSDGLGVAYVGSEPLAGALSELFTTGSGTQDSIHRYFARLGVSVVDRFEKQTVAASALSKAKPEAEPKVNELEVELQGAALRLAQAKAEAESQAMDWDAKFRAVKLQLSKADARVKELETNVNALKLQIRIKTSIAYQRTEAAARAQREMIAAHRRLQDVLQSSSWRITGPVRQVVTRLRRLLGTN
jgi:hypothetical protein